MVDFTERIFQINKGNYKITLFLASMIDDIGESLWVLITTEDIVPKSLLNVTFNVLIFSYEVVKSISDEGCEDFRHSRLKRYWLEIGEVGIKAFFVSENDVPCFQGLGNSALVHTDEMILHKYVLRFGHFLSCMTLI